MTIGSRLKDERERLGYTQPEFAALAGTTKKSQIDYEKNTTQPKAGYLEAISKAGADVSYIVTGTRALAGTVFTPSHIEEGIKAFLIEGYRLKWVDTAPDVDWEDIVIMAVDNVREAAGLEATFGKDEKGEIVQNKRFKA